MERAYDELAATGARRRKILRLGVDGLTSSELRVAKTAASGMSNREIASQPFNSVKIVETHLGHVYCKLEIDSRKQLAKALGEMTLVEITAGGARP